LKTRQEYIFELTLHEGETLRLLNLRIIQSPQGIIIDQTDHIVDTIITPYFQSHDPFPTDSQFEHHLYDSPIITVSALHAVKKRYGGSLFHWNGILLHVTITTRIDLGYAIMRLSGYLADPTEAIFEALDHTMRYLFFYRHMPIIYPRCPLSKKSLALHWVKGNAEYLSPEFGMQLINSADADHAREIC
jgi:hypothetical protein